MFERSMPEIDRLNEPIEWIDLRSVERERTPEFALGVGRGYLCLSTVLQ